MGGGGGGGCGGWRERGCVGEQVEVRWGARGGLRTLGARDSGSHTRHSLRTRARDSAVVHAHRNGCALEGNVPRSVLDSWRDSIGQLLPRGPIYSTTLHYVRFLHLYCAIVQGMCLSSIMVVS